MPSCPHGLFIFSLVLGAQVFLSYGLTSIHLTFRIRRKTKQRCIGLNSFPSRKLNTISLPIGLSFNARPICVEHLYPPLSKENSRGYILVESLFVYHETYWSLFQKMLLTPFGKQIPKFWGHGKQVREVHDVTNFLSKYQLRWDSLHPTSKYASNPTKTLLRLAKKKTWKFFHPKGLRFRGVLTAQHQSRQELYNFLSVLI